MLSLSVSSDPGDTLHASPRSDPTSSSSPSLHSADAPVLRSNSQARLVILSHRAISVQMQVKARSSQSIKEEVICEHNPETLLSFLCQN